MEERKQKWFSDGLPNEINGFEMKVSKYKPSLNHFSFLCAISCTFGGNGAPPISLNMIINMAVMTVERKPLKPSSPYTRKTGHCHEGLVSCSRLPVTEFSVFV